MPRSLRQLLRGRRYLGALAGVVAGAMAAALPAAASADAPSTPSAVSATPLAGTTARTVTLVTGQQITVVQRGTGPASYRLRPSGRGDDGVVSLQLGVDRDHYAVPVDALPFLGKGLDASLFDVTALARNGTADAARVPVTLAFAAGARPAAPPGVTLTSVEGASARGYLDPGAGTAFARALRARIGADVAAGRRPGSTPLFGGLASMAVTGTAAPRTVAPHYPMHVLQIHATDALGAPGEPYVFAMDNDSITREAANVPMADGLGRIAVPAGDYTVSALFPRWDDQGNFSEFRVVDDLDVTVPETAGVTAEAALDARTATSAVTLSTPRPSVPEVRAVDLARVDATGQGGANMGFDTWSPVPIAVSPASVPSVGRLQARFRFDAVSADPGDGYRYDLAYSSDHIDADQSYTADPARLATLHHHFSTDPAAAGQTASLLAGPSDDGWPFGTELVSGYTALTPPQDLTEYVQTYPGSLWSEEMGGPGLDLHAESRAFRGGRTYDVDWGHGPLAPTLGTHHGEAYDWGCLMCTAGSSAVLAFETLGDSTPDHFGFSWNQTSDLALSVDGQPVATGEGASGAVVTGVPTGAATYRAVLTTDSAGDPSWRQSTHAVTDLTVKAPATADPNSALPSGRFCEAASDGSPCRILPALTMSYDLATDLTNTGHAPVQAMALTVGHLSYDGKGSTAPITSVTVKVSFDGGTTWKTATVAGAAGHYAALWANPASAAGTSPMLQVTAKDSVGGSLTQTITHAYTVAPTTAAARH